MTTINNNYSRDDVINNNFNGNAPVTNNINLSGITGNFVNMSFYFDEYTFSTGLNIVESFIARDFIFTGYSLGLINSGTSSFTSGSFYQRTRTNVKVPFVNFSINSGQIWYASGGFNQVISGLNRVGLDIYRTAIDATGFTVAAFGVGY